MGQITGEQFRTGMVKIAERLKEKIENLPEPVIKQYYKMNNAQLITGSMFGKERHLLALYDFDKHGGGAYIEDQTKLNPSITMVSPPSFEIDDEIGRQVAVFNGTSAYIPVGTFAKTPYLTACVMVKKDDWTNPVVEANQVLISSTHVGGWLMCMKNNIIMIRLHLGDKYHDISGGTKLTDLSPGYHTFIITYDGYIIKLYIDGKLDGQTVCLPNRTGVNYHKTNGIFIGAEAGTEVNTTTEATYFTGKMAEVRFYSAALNIQEVEETHYDMIHHIPLESTSAITVEGDMVQQYIVKEMSNPLMMNPLTYGVFSMSEDQVSNFNANNPVLFNTLVNGNLTIEGNSIKLHANSTYNIKLGLAAQTSRLDVQIKDTTTNQFIGTKLTCLPPKSDSGISPMSYIDFYYTPEEDCNIQVIITQNDSTESILKDYSSLSIHEIRNNPAIHYGGFDKTILFDGAAKGIDNTFTLIDDTDNYDMFLVMSTEPILIDRTPKMTSTTTPAPYKTNASSAWSSEYSSYIAFNGSESGYGWCSQDGKTANEWIQIDLANPSSVNTISIVCNYPSLAPSKISLLGSDDGIDFEPLEDIELTSFATNVKQIITLSKEYKKRVYRFRCTECVRGATYVAIAEIRLCLAYDEEFITNSILIPRENRHVNRSDYKFKLVKDILTTETKDITINRIIGIKGQLPSLLMGGEF